MEFIGYACRVVSASQPFNHYKIMPFAIQNTYLLLAPTLFAASIYMILGRIIQLTDGETRSPLARRWLTKAFVCGDVLCLLLQGGGGSMSTAAALGSTTTTTTMADGGKALTIFGLVAQLAVFGGFVVVAGVFHIRLSNNPTPASDAPQVARCWGKYMRVLYAASALVMVRNLVRVVEYCQGTGGYIITREAFLYIFDGLFMFGVVVLLAVVHPGELSVLCRQLGAGGNVELLSASASAQDALGKDGVWVSHRV